MLVNNVGLISDATFGVQQDAGATISLAGSADPSSNPRALLRSEQRLSTDSLNNQMTAKAAETMDESQRKAQKESIEQSFSAFA